MLKLTDKKINIEKYLYFITVITLPLMYMHGIPIVADKENRIWFPYTIIEYSASTVYATDKENNEMLSYITVISFLLLYVRYTNSI